MLRWQFLRHSRITALAVLAIPSLIATGCGSPETGNLQSGAPGNGAQAASSSSVPSQLQVDTSFSQAYARLGGTTWFGRPISRAFLDPDLGWRLQVFEFGVLAENPGTETAFPLWVNSLLGGQTAPVQPSADPGCKYIGATGHNVCAGFLGFYEGEAAAHLGPPVAEMGLGAAGVLHQDFEYASLDWIDGAVRLAPLGQSFFAARRYDASLLQSGSGLAVASTEPTPREAETQGEPPPTKGQMSASPAASPTLRGPVSSATTLGALAFPNGFTVGEPFLSAYLKAGGTAWLGTPLSQPFTDADLGWLIQVFEYGALAQAPGGDPAFLVEINTLLGRQTPPSTPKVDPACSYLQASGHNVCYQFRTYLQQQGVQRVGFPISEVQEDADGVLFQDFEYVRLEWLNGQVYREASGRLFLREHGPS